MTRASTVGPEPSPWPAGWLAGVSSAARNAQPRASGVGCSLLHLARPGSGRGWLARQAARARGNLRPPARASSSAGARLTRGRASQLRERRARGESPGRGAKFRPGCRRVGLRSVRTQPAGLRPPRPRAALARRQERAQWGLGRSARRGGGASGMGTPPSSRARRRRGL